MRYIKLFENFDSAEDSISEGLAYHIKAGRYHRLIKGNGDLIVKIEMFT